jgi:hypothetical protein
MAKNPLKPKTETGPLYVIKSDIENEIYTKSEMNDCVARVQNGLVEMGKEEIIYKLVPVKRVKVILEDL